MVLTPTSYYAEMTDMSRGGKAGSSIQSAFAKRAGHAIIFSMIFTLEGNSKT